jgi:hypothetical protein
MKSIRITAMQANAQAAYIKQLRSYFNAVNQFKQRFIRLLKWLNSILI